MWVEYKQEMENQTILTFKAIVGFVADLNNEFGTSMKSIALYNRLLEKTGIVHIGPIQKHIECFRIFFQENQGSMESRATTFSSTIQYSDRVYIDLTTVFKRSSVDTASVIWQHLYTLWGLVDPSSEAKRLLSEAVRSSGGQDRESQFLTDIIEKVERTVQSTDVDTSNPMGAVGKLMSSGVFTDLVQGMQTGLSDGSLDIGKLMGSVQGMMGRMGGGGGMPDLNAMMSMMGPMMGSMGSMGQKSEEKKE